MAKRKRKSPSKFAKAAKSMPRAKKRVRSRNKLKEPFRNLDRDGITYSFLDKFVLCREQARLDYVEGWTGDGIAVPLDFGIAFHECLEWVASGKSVTQIRQPVTKFYTSRRAKLNREDTKTLQLVMDMVKAVFPLYHDYWKETDKGIKYVYQEESFKVIHRLPSGKTVPLRGRLDEVFRDTDGALVLQENKTKGQIDEQGIQASLHMDLQTMLYSYCLWKMTNEAPKRILYNVIRRPQLRQKQTENERDFIRRIQDDVVSRPEHYFMRWKVDIKEQDLEDWTLRTLNPLLETVVRWWESIKHSPFDPWDSPEHFINPSGLFTRYGRSGYFDVLTKGNYHGLYQRTPYINEETQPETETPKAETNGNPKSTKTKSKGTKVRKRT
jgi:hypothetical protein